MTHPDDDEEDMEEEEDEEALSGGDMADDDEEDDLDLEEGGGGRPRQPARVRFQRAESVDLSSYRCNNRTTLLRLLHLFASLFGLFICQQGLYRLLQRTPRSWEIIALTGLFFAMVGSLFFVAALRTWQLTNQYCTCWRACRAGLERRAGLRRDGCRMEEVPVQRYGPLRAGRTGQQTRESGEEEGEEGERPEC